uniref:Uncharacterized protein n=1 Tax=Oryza brachyantha TaxID=4533 RepID=J3M3L5_ORYBR
MNTTTEGWYMQVLIRQLELLVSSSSGDGHHLLFLFYHPNHAQVFCLLHDFFYAEVFVIFFLSCYAILVANCKIVSKRFHFSVES